MPNLGFSRHKSFYVALALGIVAGVAILIFDRGAALPGGASVFFLTYVVLIYRALPHLSAEFLRQHAAEEDEPAPLITIVMLAAVIASTASLFLVLGQEDGRAAWLLILSVASVVLSWFAVHTMWAMHYAYEYYRVHRTLKGKLAEGLDFHSEEPPNGVAFLYFAYVLGMTAQTADIDVVSNAMRRLVLFQSVFAFFFNTGIVAAAVNIAVALAR